MAGPVMRQVAGLHHLNQAQGTQNDIHAPVTVLGSITTVAHACESATFAANAAIDGHLGHSYTNSHHAYAEPPL